MTTTAPIVLVAGFLGDGASWYWGDTLRGHHVFYAQLGPVSSLHDRACELFYQIRGGTVDYGEAHATEFGHARYGRTYTGYYPGWSAERPVHLLGHSLGGCTVRHLQHLLALGHFGSEPSAAWVRSITTIAAPHLGTTTSYILGEKEDVPADVHYFSIGSMLTRMIHLHEWLNLPFIRRWMPVDLQLDHWQFSWPNRTLRDLFQFIFGRSPLSHSRDNAAYDMTVHAMHHHNSTAKDHEKTYYRSYTCSLTYPLQDGTHVPHVDMSMAMRPLANAIGRYQPKDPANLSKQFHSPDWWENDGIVSTISQAHPFLCSGERRCRHYDFAPGPMLSTEMQMVQQRTGPFAIDCTLPGDHTEDSPSKANVLLEPGVWHVFHLRRCSHVCLLPFPASKAFQHAVLSDYAMYIQNLDCLVVLEE